MLPMLAFRLLSPGKIFCSLEVMKYLFSVFKLSSYDVKLFLLASASCMCIIFCSVQDLSVVICTSIVDSSFWSPLYYQLTVYF